MPEEESSLLLIKNPPSRVTIQLEGESEGKEEKWREGMKEKEGRRMEKRRERQQGDSER